MKSGTNAVGLWIVGGCNGYDLFFFMVEYSGFG